MCSGNCASRDTSQAERRAFLLAVFLVAFFRAAFLAGVFAGAVFFAAFFAAGFLAPPPLLKLRCR
ncbi:MAG: hypothetical protein EOP83_25830 [Verrucomicrobiaceae bacterium]|nr:MAG: hypothetical protein EOP83_25830 [Verrucomicrobiaceae bacterium]